MQQVSTTPPSSRLPFVLLWADNIVSDKANQADLVFSPSVSGMIQNPNLHTEPVETTGPRNSPDEGFDTSINF